MLLLKGQHLGQNSRIELNFTEVKLGLGYKKPTEGILRQEFDYDFQLGGLGAAIDLEFVFHTDTKNVAQIADAVMGTGLHFKVLERKKEKEVSW